MVAGEMRDMMLEGSGEGYAKELTFDSESVPPQEELAR